MASTSEEGNNSYAFLDYSIIYNHYLLFTWLVLTLYFKYLWDIVNIHRDQLFA